MTADQIVETYGLASSVEYDKNSLTLYWDRAKNAEHQNVYFRFEKVDGNYYLKTVEAFDFRRIFMQTKKTMKMKILLQIVS